MNVTLLEQAIHQKLMISFPGLAVSDELRSALVRRPVAGVTLFRHLNVESPQQIRALTAALQQTAREAGQPPLLIGADQEGGQLMALGEGTTPFPGNMALGAAGSEELACRFGAALGRELAALGLNVDYAPVCDLTTNPRNPAVGTRAFGEDPLLAARLAAAVVRGLQSEGVAATAKHFPGLGDTQTDPHYDTPVVLRDRASIFASDLPPFLAAIRAGARLVMTAHLAMPALAGGKSLPATLSPAILKDLLRGEIGFQGVVISDAMNMGAIRQGPGLAIDAIAAVAAGVDLLLLTSEPGTLEGVSEGLLQAAQRGLLAEDELFASARRVLELRRELVWYAAQPPLDVVGGAAHQALAGEIAARSLTLVRDSDGLLPLRLPAGARIAAVVPIPQDLTPADTSSLVRPALAPALRRYHPAVDEFFVPINPAVEDVVALAAQAGQYDLVIVGTINANEHPGQAALVRTLLDNRVPTLAVALRTPYDLQAYPAAPAYLCTYSILPPAMDALAQALWGRIPFQGRLPVTLPM